MHVSLAASAEPEQAIVEGAAQGGTSAPTAECSATILHAVRLSGPVPENPACSAYDDAAARLAPATRVMGTA